MMFSFTLFDIMALVKIFFKVKLTEICEFLIKIRFLINVWLTRNHRHFPEMILRGRMSELN